MPLRQQSPAGLLTQLCTAPGPHRTLSPPYQTCRGARPAFHSRGGALNPGCGAHSPWSLRGGSAAFFNIKGRPVLPIPTSDKPHKQQVEKQTSTYMK